MVAAFLLLALLLSCGLPQEVAGQALTQSGLLYFSFVSNNAGNFSTTPLSALAAVNQYFLGTFTTSSDPAALTTAQTSGASLALTAGSTNLTVSSTPGASSTVWTVTFSATGQATENLPYSATATMGSSGSVTGPIGATGCTGYNANGAYVDTPYTCTSQFAFILSGGSAWFSFTTDLLSPSGYVSVVQIA